MSRKAAKVTASRADRAEPVSPMDVTVRIWTDRDVEVFNPGIAPWLAQAALYRAAEYLDESPLSEQEE